MSRLLDYVLACVGGLLAFGCGTPRTPDLGREMQGASSAPVISDSFPIVSPIVGYRGDTPIVAAASGNGMYLLVHRIDRGVREHLIGVRVRSSDGVILDPNGIDIATPDAAPGLFYVVATYATDRWIIVYEGPSQELYSVTVSNAGVVGTPINLELDPVVASLVWGTDRALLTTMAGVGLFIDGTGAPIGTEMAIFPPVNPPFDGGGAAFDGESFLVSASRYGTSGAEVIVYSVTNAGPTGKSANVYSVPRNYAMAFAGSVVSDGSSHLVMYSAPPPSCAGGGRCTPQLPYYRTASVGENGDIALGSASEVSEFMSPLRAVHTNGSYLLYQGERVLRVDSNGNALGPVQPLLAGVSNEFYEALSTSGFELLSLGTSELLSYVGWLAGPLAIRVDTNLLPLDDPPFAPLELVKPQQSPSVAFDGTNYLVAWFDSGRGGVRAARVAPSGTVLDPSSITVADGTANPVMAVGNTAGTLVGWVEQDPLRLARITPAGGVTPVDMTNLAAPFVTNAALASNGTDYFAAWATPTVAAEPGNVRAALVPASSAPSAPVGLSTPFGLVAAAFDGANYVVVQSVGDDVRRELRAMRVTPALVALDTPSRALFDYAASNVYVPPVIASNGSGSLLVWYEREGESTPVVRAARLTQSLDVLDPGGVTIGQGSYPPEGAVAAWDGSSYWVFWGDRPSAASTQARLLGRRLTAGAVPIDEEPFVVASDLPDLSSSFRYPLFGVAPGPNGDLLLASVSDEPTRDGQTVRGRYLRAATGGTGGAGGEAGTGGSTTGGVAGAGASAGGASGGESGEAGDGGAGDGGAGDGGQPATGGRGGASGTGGNITGGRAGTGGMGGNATGGQAAGAGGDSGAGGDGAAGGGPSPDDSGCSCSVIGAHRSGSSLLFAMLGLPLLLRARRRGRAAPRA